MEKFGLPAGAFKEDDQIDLPPGFRFHPTDEELISHYLHKKVIDSNFGCKAIGDVDLNKSEPWDLPGKFSKRNCFPLVMNIYSTVYDYQFDLIYCGFGFSLA